MLSLSNLEILPSVAGETEQFHGSLFEYTQNSAFDAAVWGSNINGQTLKSHKVFHTLGEFERAAGNTEVDAQQRQAQDIFLCRYQGDRKRYSTPLFLDAGAKAHSAAESL